MTDVDDFETLTDTVFVSPKVQITLGKSIVATQKVHRGDLLALEYGLTSAKEDCSRDLFLALQHRPSLWNSLRPSGEPWSTKMITSNVDGEFMKAARVVFDKKINANVCMNPDGVHLSLFYKLHSCREITTGEPNAALGSIPRC